MTHISKVPLLDLTRLDADTRAELVATFERVLLSGRFILGPELSSFEEECARYVGARHAVGVSSGTDALVVSLMAAGIGAGDEVICPTYTFFATAGSVWRLGARPVFVDSAPCCFNCDVRDIERKLTERTKAILPVHLYGQCARMDPILEIARRAGATIIEDAAQAIGARYGQRGAGALGSMGCFSFFPSKNLGGFGDGGLVTTSSDELAEELRVLRVHGAKPKYHHLKVGGNFRMDEIQAALLRSKLRRLDKQTAARQRNAARYTELLLAGGLAEVARSVCGAEPETAPSGGDARAPIELPATCQARHIYNQYVLRVRGDGVRDALRAHLQRRGVGTEIYYPVPLHLQECFRSLGGKEGDCPVAERAARETIALPIFPELRDEEIAYVAGAIREFFSES